MTCVSPPCDHGTHVAFAWSLHRENRFSSVQDGLPPCDHGTNADSDWSLHRENRFSSVQDGTCALGKAHVRSTMSLRGFPNIAFERAQLFVWTLEQRSGESISQLRLLLKLLWSWLREYNFIGKWVDCVIDRLDDYMIYNMFFVVVVFCCFLTAVPWSRLWLKSLKAAWMRRGHWAPLLKKVKHFANLAMWKFCKFTMSEKKEGERNRNVFGTTFAQPAG